jgi:hypothetical protein
MNPMELPLLEKFKATLKGEKLWISELILGWIKRLGEA